MSKRSEKVSIRIDSRTFEVERGLTILEAAEQNNIYIPTLCAHKDLTPFGGCRMCIVEVEGMRGFPTACTTPVEDGMEIRTQTAQIQAERTEILQLILSEHTSSCLICAEQEECKKYMGTIRKAGVTTGCRYCPNDGQCELQEVVERLGIKEINYPIYYRGLRVEREDPFYDRDYNLCILCGRCIRMCQELRTANTLAFTQRGRHTVIGPAFGRTHLEAGCEFCGACVSVCPTGALSEKARKWEGPPEREEITTCTFCGVGCQMRLLIRGNEIIGSLPAEDELVNNAQLCVKGRFCVTESVNHHRRLKKPYETHDHHEFEVSWDSALELAAEKLSACPPADFGMLVSPNCCNEDLYIAQKFARAAVGSHNIDTTARLFYGSGFNAYLDLMRMSVPLSDVRKASVILCIGLDTRFGRSVVGVDIRRAIRSGAEIITINPRYHNLSGISDKWLQPRPEEILDLMKSLVGLTQKRRTRATQESKGKSRDIDEDLGAVAGMLERASAPVILIGSEFLQYDKGPQILEAIGKLARNIGAGVLPLPAQNNLFGSILMGVYPEILPGGVPSRDESRINDLRETWAAHVPDFSPGWNVGKLLSGKKLKVLYLIGEVPSDTRPPADFIIFQNIYPPEASYGADLVLPSAAFSEVDGTFISGEGRIQRVRKGVDPPGEALPDWRILCRIAEKMGAKGFDFSGASGIHEEIAGLVRGFEHFDNVSRKAGPLICEGKMDVPRMRRSEAKKATISGTKKATREFPLLLTASVAEHTHRGFSISKWVEGSRKLFAEGTIYISPIDARKAGILEGDKVVVTSAHFEKVWPARVLHEQPQGTLHVTLHHGESIGPNPHPVRIEKADV